MNVFTIGFTRKSAEGFFDTIKQSGARHLVDVRLYPTSQLSGFAKKEDLRFFLGNLCGMEYSHRPELAPTKEMLDGYRKDHKDWRKYEDQFLGLMSDRRIEDSLSREDIAEGCLLCSEDEPHHCHRRLVAEYLDGKWGDISISHLPDSIHGKGPAERQGRFELDVPAPGCRNAT